VLQRAEQQDRVDRGVSQVDVARITECGRDPNRPQVPTLVIGRCLVSHRL